MTRKRKALIQYGRRRPQRSFVFGDSMFFPNTQEIDQSQKAPDLPLNKPTSQKAATMPSEPPADQIAMLQEFTGIPKDLARRYLKVCSEHCS